MSLPDLSDPRIAAILAAYVGCLLLAAWLGGDNRGGRWLSPERAGAATILAMFAIQSVVYQEPADSVYTQLDPVALASDIVGFAGFTLIALYAARMWSLIAAGIQMLAVLAHLVRSAREASAMAEMAYNILKSTPTSAVVLLVLVGALLRWRRVKRGEVVRDWVPWDKWARFRQLEDEVSDF